MGKPDTLIVRAKDPSKPVFKPGHALRELDADGNDIHVIRSQPVEVPNDAFYRRQLRDGDLVELKGEELRAYEEAAAAALAAANAPPASTETVAAAPEEE